MNLAAWIADAEAAEAGCACNLGQKLSCCRGLARGVRVKHRAAVVQAAEEDHPGGRHAVRRGRCQGHRIGLGEGGCLGVF